MFNLSVTPRWRLCERESCGTAVRRLYDGYNTDPWTPWLLHDRAFGSRGGVTAFTERRVTVVKKQHCDGHVNFGPETTLWWTRELWSRNNVVMDTWTLVQKQRYDGHVNFSPETTVWWKRYDGHDTLVCIRLSRHAHLILHFARRFFCKVGYYLQNNLGGLKLNIGIKCTTVKKNNNLLSNHGHLNALGP